MSINQPINPCPSINQWINIFLSMHQSINPSIHQFINSSTHQSIYSSIHIWIYYSQFFNTSIHRLIDSSIHQPFDQSFNLPISVPPDLPSLPPVFGLHWSPPASAPSARTRIMNEHQVVRLEGHNVPEMERKWAGPAKWLITCLSLWVAEEHR